MKKYFTIMLKGFAMGAADVVPGVSGGTIAFITGIYDELLDSINSILPNLKLLFKGKLSSFFKAINGSFLISLFAGIGVAIFTLAKLFTYLLESFPVQVWSFFFGLVIGSVLYVGSKVGKLNLWTVVALLIGTFVSYWITIIPPSDSVDSSFFLFFAGAIAIMAMILPGISGSFILLLMGAYSTVLGAVKDLNFLKIGIFMLGCLVGLLSFSKVLKWTLNNFRKPTLALLTGFLVGSLNKLWPWKENILNRMNSKKEIVPFIDKNVAPSEFSHIGPADLELGITSQEPVVMFAVIFCFIGLALILLFWKLEPKGSE
jgi:putative membrane protein